MNLSEYKRKPVTSDKEMDNNCYMDQIPVCPLDQNSRIFLVRNGEPCDRLMSAWTHKAFHEVDKYNFLDQNQPFTVINRTALGNDLIDQAADLFKNDTPLTQIGKMCAKRVGAAMHQRNVRFHVVFCSPALRCIETATAILSEIPTTKKEKVKFFVEPGLLDPLIFYQKEKNGLPKFLDTSALTANGFVVDEKYSPVFSLSQLRSLKETVVEYQERITTIIQHITKASKRSDSNVLVVTHAPSIDIIARKLIGRKDFPTMLYDLNRMGLFYPFTSVTTLQKVECGEKGKHCKWTLQRQAIPPMRLGHVVTTAHMPSL